MKTITSQVLMLCMSLMTTHSFYSANRIAEIADKPAPEDGMEMIASEYYSAPAESDTTNTLKKKKYQIIFDNKSEYNVDVAIRYKAYSGDWVTDAWITLKPGEKKLMGSSDETTYYYSAKTRSKWRKQAWEGKHKFKVGDRSLNKVRFRKQDIWECYNTEMCNTFAVFR